MENINIDKFLNYRFVNILVSKECLISRTTEKNINHNHFFVRAVLEGKNPQS